MPRHSAPTGFTLIEVLVALALGGFIVLAAQRVFAAAEGAARASHEARAEHERRMAASAWLFEAAGSLDVSSPGISGFRGTPRQVSFTALPARHLQLLVEGGWLVARENGEPRRLVPSERLALDYLLDIGADESWVQVWQSAVSAPRAMRLRILRPGGESVDTLLLAIGSRG